MPKKLQRLFQNIAFYPFVFSIFPILFLYSINADKTTLFNIFLPIDITLIFTGILFLFFKLVHWDSEKAAFNTLIWVLIITSFGHFQNLFFPPETLDVYSYTLLFSGGVAVLVLAIIFIRLSRFKFKNFNYKLNLFSVTFLLIPLITLFTSSSAGSSLADQNIQIETDFSEIYSEERPDIYYLIFDRYASNETLLNIYNYDNSDFYRELADRNFYVTSDSTANYLKTAHSLASSLNMSYLDTILDLRPRDYADWHEIYQLLKDYQVWHFLKELGYKFVHIGSWWEPTNTNPNADININNYKVSEFNQVYYETTMIYHFVYFLSKKSTVAGMWRSGDETFFDISEVAADKDTTFTFAHILIPHTPYVYEEDGSMVEVSSETEEDAYLKQVKHVNNKILQLVDSIIKHNSNSIIIIQSDEGPHPKRYVQIGPTFDWNEATDFEINQKMQILNAYYFPNKSYDFLYPSITPVNSFRVLFNTYFDQHLKLLEDRNYVYTDNYHPYQITEITDRLKKVQSGL